MARQIPKWATYSAMGLGILALGGATAATVSALWPVALPLCQGWQDHADAPAQIRALAAPVEKITGLKGLGDYLAGVAFIESRGNPRAGSDSGNAARGWFGMRPVSARVSDLGMSPNALKDGPTAVALAAWYIHRCIPYASPGQRLDWLSFRRCWGRPVDTAKVDHPGYKNQLARGLACAGVDPDFMYKKAIRWNYKWPGIDAVLAAVGRPRATA